MDESLQIKIKELLEEAAKRKALNQKYSGWVKTTIKELYKEVFELDLCLGCPNQIEAAITALNAKLMEEVTKEKENK